MISSIARILAYLISIHTEGVFSKAFRERESDQNEVPSYLKHIFMLSVFVIVSQIDFYPLMLRKLHWCLHFIYDVSFIVVFNLTHIATLKNFLRHCYIRL